VSTVDLGREIAFADDARDDVVERTDGAHKSPASTIETAMDAAARSRINRSVLVIN